jgi:signal transduction histidine kinase
MTLVSCRLFIREMIMKTAQDEVTFVHKPLPCMSAIPRSLERSTPAAMHDDAPVSRIQAPIVDQAIRETGSSLYEFLGMAELMRVAYEKGELASAQNRLDIIIRDAATLSSAFSMILEYIRLESRPADTGNRNFDIVALLREVSHFARTLVQRTPITVMADACTTPLVINSDPDKLRLITMGLVSNAAQFTDRGRIALILSKDNDELRLTVADTGRGMTQEQIDVLFSSSDHENDGEVINTDPHCGLGSRIVKNLVKQLHGRISVSSKLGEGTIIAVSLPLNSSS